jgi:hypothetical protein
MNNCNSARMPGWHYQGFLLVLQFDDPAGALLMQLA